MLLKQILCIVIGNMTHDILSIEVVDITSSYGLLFKEQRKITINHTTELDSYNHNTYIKSAPIRDKHIIPALICACERVILELNPLGK